MGNIIYTKMNKFSQVAALAAVVGAVQLEHIPRGNDFVQIGLGGIPYPALMQEQPSHWRKVWPEGATDNSDGDAEILDRFNKRPKEKEEDKPETYPWSLDEDVLSTGDSIKTAETITSS